MPTRQLHITAGNAPQIPIVSGLRAILTKSAGVIKSPFNATLPGVLYTFRFTATDALSNVAGVAASASVRVVTN